MTVTRPPVNAPIVEKNRFGTLFAMNGKSAQSSTRFKGYRYVKEDGQIKLKWMETTGTRKTAVRQFQNFTNAPTSIPEKLALEHAKEQKRRKEVAKLTTPKAATAKKYVYVLKFTHGKTTKILGAYADEEKALTMAESLQEALVLTDGDGEWSIDDVELK